MYWRAGPTPSSAFIGGKFAQCSGHAPDILASKGPTDPTRRHARPAARTVTTVVVNVDDDQATSMPSGFAPQVVAEHILDSQRAQSENET